MTAATCPTCGQPMPADAPAKPGPKRVQTTYRPFTCVHTADDLAAALAEYRAAHGADPRSIVVSPALALAVDDLDGVPVIADPVVSKPAGYAYLEVA